MTKPQIKPETNGQERQLLGEQVESVNARPSAHGFSARPSPENSTSTSPPKRRKRASQHHTTQPQSDTPHAEPIDMGAVQLVFSTLAQGVLQLAQERGILPKPDRVE